MKYLFAVIFAFVIGFGVQAHPIKMTTARLCIFENKQAELTINFFIDDFEKALKAETGKADIQLHNNMDVRKVVATYIWGHLSIALNNKPITFFVTETSNPDENVFQIKFRSLTSLGDNLKNLEISNRLLFEMSDEQSNVIHLETKDGKQVLRFIPIEYFTKITL